MKKAYFYSFLSGFAFGLPLFLSAPADYQIGGYLIGMERRIAGVSGAAVGSSFYIATLALLLALVFLFGNAILGELGAFKKYTHREIFGINAFFATGMLVSAGLFIAAVAGLFA